MCTGRAASITVVGLGPGGPGTLTADAERALGSARAIWLRTLRHPAARAVAARWSAASCDDLYESHDDFDDVYHAIAARIAAEASDGEVVYAVPGDPACGETSVGRIRALARERGIPVTLIPGVSFLGPTLALLGWDAMDGLQVVDGTALAARQYPDVDPGRPALVAQVYNRMVASHVKLALLFSYPPDHPLYVVSGAAGAEPRLRGVALSELDHGDDFDDLTTVAVPPRGGTPSLAGLAELVARLRAPGGCPWDREQTHESLRPYLLEEAYEVLQALDGDDRAALGRELGDLLLQIVLHAQLAAEAGDFTLPDVVDAISSKILRRHPHVFGSAVADTPAEVRVRWEEVKRLERAGEGRTEGPLAGLPKALPALALAQTAQRRLADSGLIVEDDSAGGTGAAGGIATPDEADRSREMGRMLWRLVALSVRWGVDAESALREETDRVRQEWEAVAAGAPAAAPVVPGEFSDSPEEGETP